MAEDGGLSTPALMRAIEGYGYQFLKDRGGWACYDTDTRVEVDGTRDARLGDAVHLAKRALGL